MHSLNINSITYIQYTQHKLLSTVVNEAAESVLDGPTYDRVCNETLLALNDYFEELVEEASHLKNADVAYSVCL